VRWKAVLGHKVSKLSARQSAELRSQHIGFIFQTYNLLPVYNVYENVEFPLLLLKLSSEERRKYVNEALEWVGLTDRSRAVPLSYPEVNARGWPSPGPWLKSLRWSWLTSHRNLDTENSLHILRTMREINLKTGTILYFQPLTTRK
jgi:putative ABC transport system ATP-binding protein